jgi:hypothetical protein
MWARVIEIMLACWLAISPFMFAHDPTNKSLWINDLSCALAVLMLSGLSFWNPLRFAHLGVCVVGLWLVGFGYLMSPYPPPPALQNSLLVGLLLLMLGIVPNKAFAPPDSWREFLVRERN